MTRLRKNYRNIGILVSFVVSNIIKMVNKYHCEYCDREFRDTAADRRKHRLSVAHQSAKFDYEVAMLRYYRDHYGQLRLLACLTPEEYSILCELIDKPIACKYYHQQPPACKYGDRCKSSHRLKNDQILTYKDDFLNRFSRINGIGYESESLVPTSFPRIRRERRGARKKEIRLNRWLETQFSIWPFFPQ